jgi:hypothetical protein
MDTVRLVRAKPLGTNGCPEITALFRFSLYFKASERKRWPATVLQYHGRKLVRQGTRSETSASPPGVDVIWGGLVAAFSVVFLVSEVA